MHGETNLLCPILFELFAKRVGNHEPAVAVILGAAKDLLLSLKHEMRHIIMNKSIALLALGACMSTALSAQPANPAIQQQFQKVADEYFDKIYFPNQPTIGTLTGYHQYDTQLEDYSHKKIDAWIADLVYFQRRVESIPAAGLDQTTRGDREMLLGNIQSHAADARDHPHLGEQSRHVFGRHRQRRLLADGAQFRPARRAPPFRHRARDARCRRALDQARANLKNPPHIYTEIAIEQLPGIVSFFENDVPRPSPKPKIPALKAEFAKTNAAVIDALKATRTGSRPTCLPRSHGDFRLGRR